MVKDTEKQYNVKLAQPRGRKFINVESEIEGVNMTLGAGNVSFGMPGRPALGSSFLPMAMMAGLTSAIMDSRTPQMVESVRAADLMLGNDEWGAAWIAAHRAKQAATA